ncbi:hypothetical protein Tco_0552829 [Tanacetum coccineum]
MTEKVRVVLSSVVGVEEGKSVLCEGVNGMRNSVCRLVLLKLIISLRVGVERVVIAAMVFTQTPKLGTIMPVIEIDRFAVATAARSITSSVAVTATFGGEENHRLWMIFHIEYFFRHISVVRWGFAFFYKENITGRYLALKAKEETELILWKSRRRKRKYNNAIVTIN